MDKVLTSGKNGRLTIPVEVILARLAILVAVAGAN